MDSQLTISSYSQKTGEKTVFFAENSRSSFIYDSAVGRLRNVGSHVANPDDVITTVRHGVRYLVCACGHPDEKRHIILAVDLEGKFRKMAYSDEISDFLEMAPSVVDGGIGAANEIPEDLLNWIEQKAGKLELEDDDDDVQTAIGISDESFDSNLDADSEISDYGGRDDSFKIGFQSLPDELKDWIQRAISPAISHVSSRSASPFPFPVRRAVMRRDSDSDNGIVDRRHEFDENYREYDSDEDGRWDLREIFDKMITEGLRKMREREALRDEDCKTAIEPSEVDADEEDMRTAIELSDEESDDVTAEEVTTSRFQFSWAENVFQWIMSKAVSPPEDVELELDTTQESSDDDDVSFVTKSESGSSEFSFCEENEEEH